MNANELADLIERCNDCGYNQDAANMLRQMGLAESIIKQQQIEIETLKNGFYDWSKYIKFKTKELTNKEILEEWDWDSGEILATDLLDFADAILRKAQEK